MRTKELFKFIRERHRIWERRQAGAAKPWTANPILQSYRFCNVYRELDTVTIWIRKNWREPNDSDPNLWFAMVIARLVNWPSSLADIGYMTGATREGEPSRFVWNPGRFVGALDRRKLRGEKVFTGAYMIHAGPAEGASKAKYLADEVLTPLWAKRDLVPKLGGKESTLREFHSWLMTNKDLGSFMAGQVIADIKFQSLWNCARDFWTFAAQGPGSTRGMSRVEFGDVNTKYSEADWRESLAELQKRIDPLVEKARLPRISAQDLQNCLCEFDKYERVRLGEGKPRSLYTGKE